jgi:hypothetical protein
MTAKRREGVKILIDAARKHWRAGRLISPKLKRLFEESALTSRKLEEERSEGRELEFDASATSGLLARIEGEVERLIRDAIHGSAALGRFKRSNGPENLFRAIHATRKTKNHNVITDVVLSHIRIIKPTKNRLRNPFGDDLDRAISRLQWLGRELNDPEITRDSYRLTDEQSERLEAEVLVDIATLETREMSSGLAALAMQLSLIQGAVGKLVDDGEAHSQGLVIMIDEGDVFLHLAWQQKYVSFVDDYIGRIRHSFASVQVIMTTHSPLLMSDFPRDCIHRLEIPQSELDEDFETAPPATTPVVSFGAPLEAIIRYTGDAGGMGEFASKHLKAWAKREAIGHPIPRYHWNLIDDPVIRRMLSAARRDSDMDLDT